MTYQKGDYPFEISDVVALVGLIVKKAYPSHLYAQCPFCDDRKSHLRVDLEKDYYNCPRCGTGGGMLDLYGRLTGQSRSQAYDDICQKRCSPMVSIKRTPKTTPLPMIKQRTMPEVREVYRVLLSLLPLKNIHYQSLLARGLTPDNVKRLGYRSIDRNMGRCRYSDQLTEMGFDLEGVPGFYLHPSLKRWVMHSPYSGIIYPQIGSDGQIGFLSIRRDQAKKQKYSWFSSTAKERFKGCALSSIKDYPGLLHYAGDFDGGTLLITEGQIKAEVIHCIFLRLYPYHKLSVLRQSGVAAQRLLPEALQQLSTVGFDVIVEAYDRDKFTHEVAQSFGWKNFKENDAVQKAAGNLECLVLEETASWRNPPRFLHLSPSRYLVNGYDDSLLLVYNKVRKAGDLSVRGIEPSDWPYALKRA